MAGSDVDVSVIICVRNGARTIRRQLDALDRQRDHPPFEVIVVDNGSRDATVRIVRDWVATSSHAATDVRFVRGPRRPGIPRVRNLGARSAAGRVLAFCDADDEVGEQWVGALARAVCGDVLVGGRNHAYAEDGTARPDMFGDGVAGTPYLPHVGTSNCAMSRRAFLAVNGFDESLPRYGFEDVDLSWRMQEAGYPLLYARDAVVSFTVSSSARSIRKKFTLGRGYVLMAARYPAFDPVDYTVARTLRDFWTGCLAFIRACARRRAFDRRTASRLVARAGRVVGAVQYGTRSSPRGAAATQRGDGAATTVDGQRRAESARHGVVGGGARDERRA